MFIDVKDLSISYGDTPTVEHISFALNQGETLAIVGESGSGKTSIIRAIMGCLPANGHITKGSVCIDGREVWSEGGKQKLLPPQIVSMVFQDCGNMLNPIRTLGSQFVEYIRHHRPQMTKNQAWALACHLLAKVHLHDGDTLLKGYAFELSGGMRQRIGLAMALALEPQLLLADEPTSALDVTTQAQILEDLSVMQNQGKMTMVLVTHNLGIASYMAHKIMVLKEGHVVEYGLREQVLKNPKEDYTKALLESVPKIGGKHYYD